MIFFLISFAITSTYGNGGPSPRVIDAGIGIPSLQRIPDFFLVLFQHAERFLATLGRLRHIAGFLCGSEDAFAAKAGLALGLEGCW